MKKPVVVLALLLPVALEENARRLPLNLQSASLLLNARLPLNAESLLLRRSNWKVSNGYHKSVTDLQTPLLNNALTSV
jgi:hypothetical protein